MIKFQSELRFQAPNLDLTEDMLEGADLVAQEIRGNIKRGTDPSEQNSLRLNSPKYAAWKVKKFGHQKPLIAAFKLLVEKSSYVIKSAKRNNVQIRLTDRAHPGGSATVAQIASWNHYGTGKIPARPFFSVSLTATKRVRAKLADKIARLIRGKK